MSEHGWEPLTGSIARGILDKFAREGHDIRGGRVEWRPTGPSIDRMHARGEFRLVISDDPDDPATFGDVEDADEALAFEEFLAAIDRRLAEFSPEEDRRIIDQILKDGARLDAERQAEPDAVFDRLLDDSTLGSPAAQQIRGLGEQQMESWAKRQAGGSRDEPTA